MRKRSAFSLVEAMLSLVLASGALVAALGVVSSSAQAEAHAKSRAIADSLVAEFIADATGTAFEQPGSVGSFGRGGAEVGATSRAAINDVDDYDQWVESPPKDYGGDKRADLAGWKVSVVVARVSLADPEGAVVTYDSRVKRIEVTASLNGKTLSSQTMYRTSAWDDARLGIYTKAAAVGVKSDGTLVDILDGAGNVLSGVTGVVGGSLDTVGGAVGGVVGGVLGGLGGLLGK